LINGESRSATWKPISVEIIDEDLGRPLFKSDWLGSDALIFKPRAVESMEPLLREFGELLPLKCDGERLAVYNPRALDALDETLSSIVRFESKRIMDITRYVFHTDVIKGVEIFSSRT
jgi:hypothetical protein